jgi:uncharacterized protein YkwD
MKRLVVLVVVVCVAMGAWGVHPVEAAPPAPKLKAQYKKRADTVQVTWRTRKIDRHAITVIELERADDGGAFAALDVVPRRPSKYVETLDGGTYRYRARVIMDNEVSDWSNTATVEVPGATAGAPAAGDPPLASGQRECAAGTVDRVLALVNAARHDAGAAALHLDDRLQWAARKRAIDMAKSGKLTHDGWLTPINQSGYPWHALGENIAVGYGSADAVVNAWLGSSGHRANMLAGYRDTGIGCVIDRNGSPWWSEDFGI